MAEHLYAVLICIHACGITRLVNVLNDIVDVAAYIFPGLPYLFQTAPQVALLEQCLLTTLLLLFPQIGQVVFPHHVNYRLDLCVKFIKKSLLFLVVPVDLLGVDGLALLLNCYDILEKIHNLMISGIVGVFRVVGQHSSLPVADLLRTSTVIDPVDCKTLAGGLSGTHSTIIHIFILDIDEVLGFFVRMVFIGAEPILYRLPIRLLGPNRHLFLSAFSLLNRLFAG